jgi:hypothetical protein
MNNEMQRPTLAERRQALIAECSLQRTVAGRELANLRAPSMLTGGGIVQHLRGNLKVPLMIAGVVLGMVAVKPSRAMPLLATGLSLFKLVQGVLSVVRSRSV